MEIGRIMSPDAIRAALELARNEYDRALSSTKEGRAEFYRFTDYPSFAGEMLAGGYKLWGIRDSELRAVGCLRGDSHISMLFVQSRYQGHGLGRAMCENLIDEAHSAGVREITVNSAPEAVGFYERTGFTKTADEQERNGIRFVPMVYRL